jgi:hypothetical protein
VRVRVRARVREVALQDVDRPTKAWVSEMTVMLGHDSHRVLAPDQLSGTGVREREKESEGGGERERVCERESQSES